RRSWPPSLLGLWLRQLPSLRAAPRRMGGLFRRSECTMSCAQAHSPQPPDSLDFCYSLEVLHHGPDTQAAIAACAALLKPGAPLLLYLLYSLDNRPPWFRAIWTMTDGLRGAISGLPCRAKRPVMGVIARCGHWPL